MSFKIVDFIDLFYSQWQSQNEVGNFGIPVLWKNHKKNSIGYQLF